MTKVRDYICSDARSYREIARQMQGVSAATLCRVANGHKCDVATLAKLCRFYRLDGNDVLGLPTNDQFKRGRKSGWYEAGVAIGEALSKDV